MREFLSVMLGTFAGLGALVGVFWLTLRAGHRPRRRVRWTAAVPGWGDAGNVVGTSPSDASSCGHSGGGDAGRD